MRVDGTEDVVKQKRSSRRVDGASECDAGLLPSCERMKVSYKFGRAEPRRISPLRTVPFSPTSVSSPNSNCAKSGLKAHALRTSLYRFSLNCEPKTMFCRIVSLMSHAVWEAYAAVSVKMVGSSSEARTTGEGRNEEPLRQLVSPRRESSRVVLPLPTATCRSCGQRKFVLLVACA